MDKSILQSVIADQQKLEWHDNFLHRETPPYFSTSGEVTVISGIRRCGKSTLLQQIRKDADEKDYYLNFDDDRLIHFKVEHFQMLLELFIELYGNQHTFYFDEIQNVEGWERFVRRLHDYGNKVYITGSNASMLSRELGTHLTGRYISYELFPFSFKEYLKFNMVEITAQSFFNTEQKALIQKHFNTYFQKGGFPGYLQNNEMSYLKSLYESVLYRDIMVRNNLTNERELLELVFYLSSNVAKLTSYNALTKITGVANASTIKNYLDFLQNSYLTFITNKFDYSLKKQINNPKKIYFIDNAIVKMLGFSFSDNSGRMLENIVFLELRRRGYNLYYHKLKTECDFLVRKGSNITEAIQVTWSMPDLATRRREIAGIREAMEVYNLDSGLIITYGEEGIIAESGKTIEIKPAWKWFLT